MGKRKAHCEESEAIVKRQPREGEKRRRIQVLVPGVARHVRGNRGGMFVMEPLREES